MTDTPFFEIEFQSPDAIRTDVLDTFQYSGDPQLIQYSTDEFSAVCPFSGLPDLGTVWVRYIPSEKILELKSFKYYLVSFRQVGIYQEDVTNRIFQDLWEVLSPKWLWIRTVYATRGGVDAACVMERGDRGGFQPSDLEE